MIVIYFHNEQITLLESIKSVLKQKDVNLEVFLVNNGSDDESNIIASTFESSDERVTLLNSDKFLSIDKIHFFALEKALEMFNFDYLMFLGGDDTLIGYTTLKEAIDRLNDNALLSGVVPIFYNQFESAITLKLSRVRVVNRIRLIKDWKYVHAVLGVYRKDVWVKVYKLKPLLIGQSAATDWMISLFLFKFKIESLVEFKYFKFVKGLDYNSHYYTGIQNEQLSNLESSSHLPQLEIKLGIMRRFLKIWNLLILQPCNKTSQFFTVNQNFLSKHFRFEKFIYSPIFFLHQFLKPLKFKYKIYRKKYHTNNESRFDAN